MGDLGIYIVTTPTIQLHCVAESVTNAILTAPQALRRSWTYRKNFTGYKLEDNYIIELEGQAHEAPDERKANSTMKRRKRMVGKDVGRRKSGVGVAVTQCINGRGPCRSPQWK